MKKILTFAIIALAAVSCTNLDENVYSSLMSANYYRKKSDVVKAVFRPFEHYFESVQRYIPMQELCSDVFFTPQMDDYGWWDGGKWDQWHKHDWQDISGDLVESQVGDFWTNTYQGIAQCNLVLDDIKRLDHSKFPDITEAEWGSFEAQLRCMRAYAYLKLFNFYRNCQLITSSSTTENEKVERKKQVKPQVLYDFIEDELLDCINLLPSKIGTGGPDTHQGELTKGAAATLLVRLYLNTEVWMGYKAYDKCKAMCDRILGGEFGTYALAENWYAPFDWDNDKCPEVIFGFPASFGTTSWHMQNDRRTVYGRGLPYNSQKYLEIDQDGSRNPRWHLSPSFDNRSPRRPFTGAPYNYTLGCPTQKFEKYPGDLRYKQYKNTSVNTREGMFFLEGYIVDKDGNRATAHAGYDLYLLDQCGGFMSGAPTGTITDAKRSESTIFNGDMNSGLYCVKYPFYSYAGGYYMEPDYTDMRLAEIIYSKAECLYREGDKTGAGKLLNSVRKRNYENFKSSIAYQGSDGGSVVLTDQEFIDEWMREFIFEGRRRDDLIRWGRFEEAWWEKTADSDTHKRIYPLAKSTLELNRYLKQNPGYPGIN
ncbi:MAG: RagB/SusD family nutrient uptake outer membrane protein [Bacteroidales bacterium]|nr:RagB/SusD family nutrient uptake outer membrane protein [Bacteroidales bacterium]